ncbi:HlyD family efflux transporter periplasmic adaptor subunit [Vibrio campbellii]|uniref:HlyD family efflux transporter periplasmic adaptor subunit n=1 Tax=Vibrio campbellii TaxID=680 RepID=UPI000CD358DF|nr:HlyD family efflux transporter periplasmic adaptor subunit [Vibrio campbellii]AUW02450.1 hypothetical protein C1N51_00980 [Vibrio campbellii]AUW04539.1 hypothetical protein C1N51_12890 [Vibrio campbellii]
MNDSNIKKIIYVFVFLFLMSIFFATKIKFNEKVELKGVISYESEVVIRAPFDGYIKDKFYDMNDTVVTGVPILSIYSVDSLNTDNNGNSDIDAKIKSIQRQVLDNEKSYDVTKNIITNNINKVKRNIENEQDSKEQLEIIQNLNKEVLDIKSARIDKDKKLLLSGTLSHKDYEDRLSDLLMVRNKFIESQISLSNSLNKLDNLNLELIDLKHQMEELELAYATDKEVLNEQLVIANKTKELILKSPQDGTLVDSKFNVTKQFNKGDILARVVSKDMVVKLLLESDSQAIIAEGDSIEVSVLSLPYDTYGFLQGTILKIRDISTGSNKNTHEVEVAIDFNGKISKEILMNGMGVTGYVNAESTSILRLLLLPLINSADKNFETTL